ncbi:hypothetical protein ACQEVF_27460 [Nonomuraea polychroma]
MVDFLDDGFGRSWNGGVQLRCMDLAGGATRSPKKQIETLAGAVEL